MSFQDELESAVSVLYKEYQRAYHKWSVEQPGTKARTEAWNAYVVLRDKYTLKEKELYLYKLSPAHFQS